VVGPRKRPKIVPDGVISSFPLDTEPLFSALSMVRESSIGKAEQFHLAFVIQSINDPTRVKRPQAKDVNQHANRSPNRDRRGRPAELDPTEVEHLPAPERVACALKDVRAMTEKDAVMVDGVTGRR
jgi:hypothetical protein